MKRALFAVMGALLVVTAFVTPQQTAAIPETCGWYLTSVYVGTGSSCLLAQSDLRQQARQDIHCQGACDSQIVSSQGCHLTEFGYYRIEGYVRYKCPCPYNCLV